MACMLYMACIGLLAIFAQAQELQDCSGVVASPFSVSTTEDASTLATSLGCSSSNSDFVVQWVGEVFVAETIHVTNGTSLNITGAEPGAVADGHNITQLFVVDRGSSLHFSDMTLAHGNASFGGAINAFEANVSFNGYASLVSNYAVYGGAICARQSVVSWDGDSTEFISNTAGHDGGAIYAWESAVSWDGDGARFMSNSANSSGGAIYAYDGSTVFWNGDGTLFNFNTAGGNGGAIVVHYGSTLFWDGDDTQFTSNSANTSGGAIYAYKEYAVSWTGDDTQFSFNNANDNGGAMHVGGMDDGRNLFSFLDSTMFWNGDGTNFSFNSASGSGGAIYVDSSWGESTTSYWSGDGIQFSFNCAGDDGGAIYVHASDVSWNGTTQFTSNSANSSGGAIFATDYSNVLWIGDAQFTSNSANSSGGAIYVDDESTLVVYWGGGDGTQFTSNSANNGGGAIFADSADVNLDGDNMEFMFNYAGDDGGAINVYRSDVSLHGDSIQFHSNSAGGNGGAIFVTFSSSVFSDRNTTFSRNFAGENGGAVAIVENYEEAPILPGGTFIENSAKSGGALYFDLSLGFNVANATFKANSASGGPGGAVAAYSTGREYPGATFTGCNFTDNMSETGGAVETLAGLLEFTSCLFEGNSAGVGGALRLGGTTVVRECSFLANSASLRGLAVAVDDGSANITSSSFEGNELYCATGSYRDDTVDGGTRFEMECYDCPGWEECSECSIAKANVTSTCEAPLEHTEANKPGVTLETLSIAEGYWRATNDTVKILACYNAGACIGGQTGADGYCAQGYTGPYCAICEPDYSPSLSSTCKRCSSSRRQGLIAVTLIAALVVAGVVVAIVRYLVWTQPDEEERNAGCFHRRILRAIPLQALKIAVVVWQILIQFADAAQVTYPGVYQDFLSAIDVVNFDLGYVLSAGCLWSNMDFHDRLLVNTLGPLIVVGLLGTTYRVAMYRSSAASSDAVVDKIRYRHQTVLLLVTFLIYSSVSSTVFQTFACEKLDDGGEYLRADYRIQCTGAKHKNFEVYAGIMIFVYPVGIPLLYTILLFQRRDVLANGDDVGKPEAQSISSLWEPYRPERFYYEVVECGRRIMLTGVVVFIFPNDAAQLAITMLLAFFFFMVFEMLRPYKDESDMWLSRGGHVTVFLGMFYLLLEKVDVSGERSESQAAYGGLLVACNVLMVFAIVVEVVGICRASRGTDEVVEGMT